MSGGGDSDDKATTPPVPARVDVVAEPRKSTGIVQIEASVETHKIDADLARVRLEIEDRDRARDDRRATIRTVLLWSTGFVGTVGALVLLGLAIYYRADFHFSGFGINAGTAKTTAPDAEADDAKDTQADGAPATLDTDAP